MKRIRHLFGAPYYGSGSWFERNFGINRRPCGCSIKNKIELYYNTRTLLYGWFHIRPYWNWDGAYDYGGPLGPDDE